MQYKIFLISLFIPITLFSEECQIQSINTGDSYTYHIQLPENYDPNQYYDLVLYLDEILKSGSYIKTIALDLQNDQSIKQVILVGIAHHGHNRTKRRRDFIQGHQIREGENEYFSENIYFGQANKFHDFLREELIPELEQQYLVKKKTIVGHSLGGLFVIYSFLQQEGLFDNYLAISPSLWANYQNIFQIEEWLNKQTDCIDANLYLSCGGFENLNLIKYHVNLLDHRLESRSYRKLNHLTQIFPGKTHISVIRPSLENGLKFLLKREDC